MADEILNPLVVALSSRKLTWSQWRGLNFQNAASSASAGDGSGSRVQILPKAGWVTYFETRGAGSGKTYYVPSDPAGTANGVYSRLISADRDGWNLPSSPALPEGMTYALVASRESENSPVIRLMWPMRSPMRQR